MQFPLSALPLPAKISGLVLLLFLCSVWLLTFFLSNHLEYEMTAQIEAQQVSIASYIADSIEGQVKLRINSLTAVADRITPELIANPGKLRKFLHDSPLLATLFQTGCTVISMEGIGIADYPALKGRAGGSSLQVRREFQARHVQHRHRDHLADLAGGAAALHRDPGKAIHVRGNRGARHHRERRGSRTAADMTSRCLADC